MNAILAADAAAVSTGASAPEKRPTLLVVDDDPSVRHALWITFRDSYQVHLAESGSAGLRAFQANRPDVALLDIRMPGMTGLELLRELKGLDAELEVILLSAFETVEYVREALRLGACDYLTKPCGAERLRQAVEHAMRRREVSRKTASYNARLLQLEKEIQHQQVREELARTRNEIYASIIHDINGPLTVIAGYVELMQHSIEHAEVLERDQVELVRNHARNVALQVTNCIELSRRYLGFLEGKMTANSQAGVKETFYDLAELLKAHPQARRNDLVITPFGDNVIAMVHRTDLLQVLLNLTINALQCSPLAHRVEVYGKVISSKAPRPFLQPAANTYFLPAEEFPSDTGLVAISVQDNGPGMPPEMLSRIFEPYYTTKPPGQGTGLGLAIVRRLVFQAKGAIHVYSHPGEGTVFTIYLPVAR